MKIKQINNKWENCFRAIFPTNATPSLLQHPKEMQWQDIELRKISNRLQNGEQLGDWSTNHEGFMYYKGRIVIVDRLNLWEALMKEAHWSKFTIHRGSTKIYQDMKSQYWWKDMKKKMAYVMTKCMICQQVKAEH